MRGSSRLLGVVFALAVSLGLSPHARAQVPLASAKAQPAGPLRVWLDVSGSRIDREELRQSLARELKREVVLTSNAGEAAVQVRVRGEGRAQVEYTTPSGERLTREVELPPDPQRSLEVVSWLTVNLVRDEASELLDELRARRKEEADARAAEEQAAADKAAADKAAADKAAADKAAADKAAADKAAADKAAAERKIKLQIEEPGNGGLLRDPKRSFDLALATPISLIPDSVKRELWLQLALGYGDSGGIHGIGVSALGLRIRRDLVGQTVGGAFVTVGGNVHGTVVSTAYSHVGGNLIGVLVGAGAAIQAGKVARGVIVSVGLAAAGEMDGVLVGAGIATARSLEGVAVAAGVTAIRGPGKGILIAAGGNFVSDFDGIQVAAGINIARDFRGVALAPVNVQRRARGLQLGIVNIAEQQDGVPIGIINLAKNGRLQPVVWAGSDGSAHVALKSIAGYTFTQLGGGIELGSSTLSYDAGIGAHVRLSPSLFFEPGVHYSGSQSVSDSGTAGETQHDLHYLAGFGLRVADKLDFLAAGGVRQHVTGPDADGVSPEARLGIAFF
jgi:hypothetical protein